MVTGYCALRDPDDEGKEPVMPFPLAVATR